jgi:uncharacterized membrane protein YkgB
MAMSSTAKLGVSVGLGGLTTILTDSAIQYFAPAVDAAGKANWYYTYSSLLGGAASLVTAGVLWELWSKEEGIVAGLTGVLTALAIPTRQYVVTAATKQLAGNVRQLVPAVRAASAQ